MKSVSQQLRSIWMLSGALAASSTLATSTWAQTEPEPLYATTIASTQRPVVTSPGRGLSITGAMGLPLNPTAQIPNRGEIRIQADYVDLGEIDNDSESLDDFFTTTSPDSDRTGRFGFYGLHGATRLGDSRFELSGGVEKLRARGERVLTGELDIFGIFQGDIESNVTYDEMDRSRFAIGLKYLLTSSQDPDALHIAVGGGLNPALFSNESAYVVATKPFQMGSRRITTHFGARYDRFRFQSRLVSTIDFGGGASAAFGTPINSDEVSRKFSAFAGVELPIDRRGRFSVVGEIGTKNSEFNDTDRVNIAADLGLPTSKFPYSLALRYGGASGLAGTLGVMRQGVTGDSSVFAQIGYGF